MQELKAEVSVIMINYNTFELTQNAINSIFENTKDVKFEIILVDNLSPDGSGERLSEVFDGKIVYIQSGGNLGTSKAFNLGLSRAKGKYVLWLNTDILVKENFIYILYKYMEEHSFCGICGGNIFDFNGKPTHSFRKDIISLKTLKKDKSIFLKVFRKLFKKSISLEYNFTRAPMEVGYITGADMFVRKSILDELGAFDEDIFMYAEEVEFTYRVKKYTDYKVVSVPEAHIYHLEGASIAGGKKQFSEFRFKTSTNGLFVYFKKCYGEKTALKFLKTIYKSYLKFMIICKICFLKGKYAEYKLKRQIVKKMLEDKV